MAHRWKAYIPKWRHGLKLYKDVVDKIPVWIQLHNVPLEYWTAEGLSHLASVVGILLYADSATKNCRRINFARLCVELDAAKPLVKEFDVVTLKNSLENPSENTSTDVSRVRVVYQWKPPACTHCAVFAHSTKSCTSRSNQTARSPSENFGASTDNQKKCKSPVNVVAGSNTLESTSRGHRVVSFQLNKEQISSPSLPTGLPTSIGTNAGHSSNRAGASNEWRVVSRRGRRNKPHAVGEVNAPSQVQGFEADQLNTVRNAHQAGKVDVVQVARPSASNQAAADSEYSPRSTHSLNQSLGSVQTLPSIATVSPTSEESSGAISGADQVLEMGSAASTEATTANSGSAPKPSIDEGVSADMGALVSSQVIGEEQISSPDSVSISKSSCQAALRSAAFSPTSSRGKITASLAMTRAPSAALVKG